MHNIEPSWYRVSIKALIRDSQNRILFINEGKGNILPGGGMEHGETPQFAIKREMIEEVNLKLASVSTRPHSVLPYYHPNLSKVGVWLVYEATIAEDICPPDGTTFEWVPREKFSNNSYDGNEKGFILELYDYSVI